MTDRIDSLLTRIRALEDELEEEFDRQRSAVKYQMDQGRIVFERDVVKRHKALRQKLMSYLAGAHPLVVLTAPVIYVMIIPFVVLDLFVSIYQAICFPVYKIERVKRADYISFDRQHLSYLNGLEKFNCIYCAYGNGLLGYAAEIAGRTEKHWCPIKHAKRIAGLHKHYSEFVEYGDAEAFQKTKGRDDPSAKK